MRAHVRLKLTSAAVTLVALALAGGLVGAPSAAAEQPAWNVRAVAAPTNLPPGGEGEVLVMVTNLGDMAAPASGAEPITVSTKLPAGLTATSISGYKEATQGVPRPKVSCEELPALVCRVTSKHVLMYASVEIVIHVAVAKEAQSGLPVVMSVAGGGAAPVSVSDPLTVSATPSKFGVERFEVQPLNADGSLDTQAGSHPFQLTTTLAFNEASGELREENEEEEELMELVPEPLALPKDQTFSLPPGLLGDPSAIPQCPLREFEQGGSSGACPSDTAVGVASVDVNYQETGYNQGGQLSAILAPVYNLEPAEGEPARFGFRILVGNGTIVSAFLNTSLRTGRDYGVDVSIHNTSEAAGLVGAQVSLWGVPGDPRHDLARGECVYKDEIEPEAGCTETGALKQVPFLSLPASCGGLSDPLTSTVETTTWQQPAVPVTDTYRLHDGAGTSVGLDGCESLSFEPSLNAAPNGQSASTPTGLSVGVKVNQQAALNPTGDADADVKDTTVALPAGIQLSPSAADGLEACSEAQIGFEGLEELEAGTETKVATFSPEVPSCPDGSKIATVRIKTPLLPNELTGAVYLAAPQNFSGSLEENPFRGLVAMYLVARDPVSGVLVKLPGSVNTNPVTGQLTAMFENTPQLPFEELNMEFFGSDRAPLTTPAVCGRYTTSASFTPSSGGEAKSSSSGFAITTGPDETGAAGCSSPRAFAPGFQAGSLNLQAGAFTPFTLTMTRPDQDQPLSKVEMTLPPGLSGVLSTVKLCPEAQANAGTCGPESEIGETVVSAGLGGDPYTVTGGKVYITEKYGGGQYGLSIVNPAAAGPFVLQEGRPVIVRAAVYVDPHTAALRVVSNPLPTIIDGIPLQIQHVNVTIDREKFTFNPTGCAKTAIGGTLASGEGATATVSSPFQVANCANLAFKPKFAVSTAAKSSKADGASLTVKLTYPNAPQGAEANIAKVKVDLPKQLPSRLTTLQKACLAKIFEADPADCPAASVVGHAKAITPILPVPLEGPAYFVSHGDEAFPSLIVVLQGYGVTVDLVGTTFISKAGITSSTFKSVPDVPVGSFELALPTGKYSALAANLPAKARYSFCGQRLAMPTAFVGQNGAEIHESTSIAVSDCPKVKKASERKGKKSKAKSKSKG